MQNTILWLMEFMIQKNFQGRQHRSFKLGSKLQNLKFALKYLKSLKVTRHDKSTETKFPTTFLP